MSTITKVHEWLFGDWVEQHFYDPDFMRDLIVIICLLTEKYNWLM